MQKFLKIVLIGFGGFFGLVIIIALCADPKPKEEVTVEPPTTEGAAASVNITFEQSEGNETMGVGMTMWRELTFSADSLSDEALVIEDDRSSVITDPLRWSILEILGEGKSVAEISETLDITDARILYHMQRLAQAAVINLKEVGVDPREWLGLPVAGKIRVRAKHFANEMVVSDQSASSQSATNLVGEAMPPDVVGQFNQAFREAAEGLYGSNFQMSVNHNRARLSDEQAAEFNRRLLALIEEYFPPGKGDRSGFKYGFHGILIPIDLHPLGDVEE